MRRMHRSTREVEIKLPFDSPSSARARLDALGAREVMARELEDNVLFDRESGTLRSSGQLLRLRRAGGTGLLTFKGPVDRSQAHKVRTEHQTRVDDPDALVRILESLGFEPTYRYQKYRTVYALDDLDICLDETALGCFVELEGPPEAIDRAAQRLGFTPEQYVLESYRALHERAAGDGRMAIGDLLVAPELESAP